MKKIITSKNVYRAGKKRKENYTKADEDFTTKTHTLFLKNLRAAEATSQI